MTVFRPLSERFWERVNRHGANGCWEWTGGKVTGYGQTSSRGRQFYAHRVAYELLVGPIPEGLTLDHLCRNRGCVNPAHLEPVPMRENTPRGETITARNSKKIQCHRGHPFDAANTGKGRVGRYCRRCSVEAHRRFRARRRAAGLPAT